MNIIAENLPFFQTKVRTVLQNKKFDWLPRYVGTLTKYPNSYLRFQLNTKTHWNALAFDIDDPEDIALFNEMGMPPPTISCLNNDNNKGHLIWFLKNPIPMDNKIADKYFRDVWKSLSMFLNSDPAYTGHYVKNFLNDKHYRVRFNNVKYDLKDFQEWNTTTRPKKAKSFKEIESVGSRHLDLFNELRYKGYANANRYEESAFFDLLTEEAEAINSKLGEPIKTKHIVKSIFNFCINNKHNFKSKKKRKGYEGLSLEDKQEKSAEDTAMIKNTKTEIKIKSAVIALRVKGKKITAKNIQDESGLGKTTVFRLKALWKEQKEFV